MAFEFHDDVLVVNHSTNPTECRFYQVKTKSKGGWTLKALAKREEGASGLKPSILGKMHDHISKFGKNVREVVFVSNQDLSFIKSENSKCCFIEAPSEKFDEFVEKLTDECEQDSREDAHLYHFEKAPLPISAFDTFLKGRLAEFVEKHCGELNYNITAFYRVVTDSCRTRSIREKGDLSQDELVGAKFVTRNDVTNWLANLRKTSETKPDWREVSADLSNIDFMHKLEIRNQWKLYEAKNFERTHAHITLKSLVRAAISNYQSETQTQLDETLNSILSELQPRAKEIDPSVSPEFLKAAILYELYDEYPEKPFQVANKEFEEEPK